MGRKFYIFIIGFFLIYPTYSQVGIGNTNPKATLDISSSNQITPSNEDGVLIPKIDDFPLVYPGADQDGMLVYATGDGTPQKGFYYWDNDATTWILITGYPEWNLLGNSGTDSNVNFIGTTDNEDLIFKRNNVLSGLLNPTNTGFGVNSFSFLTSGTSNSAFGTDALKNNTSGRRNTAVGFNALLTNTTGESNTAIGANSLVVNSTGENNTAIGYFSLYRNSTGSGNTAVGVEALEWNSTGSGNTAVGVGSLKANITGNSNIAIGSNSLQNNTSGNWNTSIGNGSLRFNTSGSHNTAIGILASYRNTTGSANVSFGSSALYSNTTGQYNTAIGVNSLEDNTMGHYNIGLGANAMEHNINGSSNVAIGFNALGINQTGSNNIAIGYEAGRNELNSNRLYIENSSADPTAALIYGEFDNDMLRVNGELQIGDPSLTGYSLPSIDGTINQSLKTNGNGTLNWTNAVYQSHLNTALFSGNYVITSEDYTVRVEDNVIGITIPDAALNTNRIIIIIGVNGIASKPFTFSGGQIYDDVTNTNITNINSGERYTIQSDGTQWIVIGN
ncbi:MAG: hypothetical protein R2781_06370 [Flavobacteriaceae bacterium]